MLDIAKILEPPKTLADAVAYLQDVLSNDIKRQLLWVSKEEVEMLGDSDLGGQVRNEFALKAATLSCWLTAGKTTQTML